MSWAMAVCLALFEKSPAQSSPREAAALAERLETHAVLPVDLSRDMKTETLI